MATSTPPELPGLEHVQRLGSGGFADVHLYRQELPRMLVAVKVLRARDRDVGEQLVAEANTMAELAEHPYIVTVLRAGVTDDGRAYLVMSYYPQPNLARRARAQTLSVDEALRTGIQLASAVETAHRSGVLHRDIKPANVLVSSYGAPALADFGIAGRAATVDEHEDVGVSVAWSSPEVLRGSSNGSVAADVYSLAATISFLLSGRTPFEEVGGDNSGEALLARSLSERPRRTDREDVPESLERLLQQGLAREVAHRPDSALALALDLQQVEQELRLPRTEVVVLDSAGDGLQTVTGGATTVRSATPAGRAPSSPATGSTPVLDEPRAEPVAAVDGPRRRWPRVAVGAAAALLLVAGGAAAGYLLTDDDTDGAGTAGTSTGTASTAGSSTSGSSAASSGSDSPGSDSTSSDDARLDPCLVGTWRDVEHSESNGLQTITELDRTLTFESDRTLLITYDETEAVGIDTVFDGEVEYRAATEDGTMSFELVRNDATMETGGQTRSLTPGTSSVGYTCSGDSFTQTSPGYRAVYEKTS